MQEVYLGLGSNLGDRAALIARALECIGHIAGVTLKAHAPLYETPPMGPQDQGPYLNTAAALTTDLPPARLIEALQQIEHDLGRETPGARRHWGPRLIDIDLLLFGTDVIDTDSLTVPHPGMHERWFVLKPLADIAPDAEHPTQGKTVKELLAALENAGVPQGAAQ